MRFICRGDEQYRKLSDDLQRSKISYAPHEYSLRFICRGDEQNLTLSVVYSVKKLICSTRIFFAIYMLEQKYAIDAYFCSLYIGETKRHRKLSDVFAVCRFTVIFERRTVLQIERCFTAFKNFYMLGRRTESQIERCLLS